MIQIAQRLAITGILQHKSAVITPTIVDTNAGSVIYSGLSPTVSSVALPIVVATPGLGQVTYNGLAPTTAIVPIYNLKFVSEQFTSKGDTPWRIRYFVYDSSFVLIRTITHSLNRGAVPPVYALSTTSMFTGAVPFYVDVQVQRLTETFGVSPRDNRVNDSGSVSWLKDGIIVPGGTITFMGFPNPERFNNFQSVNDIVSGTEIGVWIYEG